MVKDRIKAKAEELFKSYGVRSVTMDDISAQMGISKKTLYQFFRDKRELVDDVIKDILDQTIASCKRCKESSDNAILELFTGLKVMDEIMATVNPTILFDLERGYPKTFNRFEKYKNDFLFNLIYDNINWGKRDGLYRKEVDEEVYAKVRLETIMMSFNELLFPRAKYTFLHIQKELLYLFLYSMVTPKGLKLVSKHLKETGYIK